ncbi:D-glucuronyl C5-epimerase family protein [Mobilicoccus massiliensis]|uniref:D-glucuronyl C5-epimerase family protein n=1 Tax=Mobilicoccus massiliensis TaxID=1522310 RepID=UPI000591370B|nr:D-glucuronyl C5-epimerase family protein [Mobilicoccus massiliensis]
MNKPLRFAVVASLLVAAPVAASVAAPVSARLVPPQTVAARPDVTAGSDAGGAVAVDPPRAPQAEPARSTVSVEGLPPFVAEDIPLRVVPDAQLPQRVGRIGLTPTAVATTNGIVGYRHRKTGVVHDHPVIQATHIMGWLESYRATGDSRYLRLAVKNADHLLGYADRSHGALFFGYHFDFALHGEDRWTLRAPWYSGMAQGQALSALLRLHDATGDPRWAEAADATFASFTRPRTPDEPWVTDVLPGGSLWLEEYAGTLHDRAYNGHNFGLFGIYEYWRETQNPEAATILRGAMTATLDRAEEIRVPGEVSRYCLEHDERSEKYHAIHVRQLNAIAGFSGDRRFAHLADALLEDAPAAFQGGPGELARGAHVLLRKSPSGKVAEVRRITRADARHVRYDARERIDGRTGVWLRMADGPYRGEWVRERPRRAFVTGVSEVVEFPGTRPAILAAGAHTGRSAEAHGPTRTVVLERPSRAPALRRVLIDGRPHVQLGAGAFAGMYVPLDDRVSLD